MAYTFGALTSDNISIAATLTTGANTNACLVMGWWLPTTLTATRGLWSFGTVFGAEVAGTTSEIILRTDNTTDGQWTTTGAALTVDTWTFLAFLGSFRNTGPAAAWRVWSGTVDTPPVECTVTQNTAPAGNFTGNGTFTIGNKASTGTVAWQGDIDQVVFLTVSAAVPGRCPLPHTGNGNIAQSDADYIYQTLVAPYWLQNETSFLQATWTSDGVGRSVDLVYWNGDATLPIGRRISRNSSNSIEVTPSVGGATVSANASPRRTAISLPPGHPIYPPGA